jgi:hypothetical protein
MFSRCVALFLIVLATLTPFISTAPATTPENSASAASTSTSAVAYKSAAYFVNWYVLKDKRQLQC